MNVKKLVRSEKIFQRKRSSFLLPGRFVMVTVDMGHRVVVSTTRIRETVRCKRREWPSKIRALPSIRPCRWLGGIGKIRLGHVTMDEMIPEPFEANDVELVRSGNRKLEIRNILF